MFAGNLGALVQTNINGCWPTVQSRTRATSWLRLRGYFDAKGGGRKQRRVCSRALLSFSYALVKLGAFTIVSQLAGRREKSLAGRLRRALAAPAVVAGILIFTCCRSSGCPSQRLFGKFYIFKAAVNSHLLWLAVLMAINSIIGAYYYLRSSC